MIELTGTGDLTGATVKHGADYAGKGGQRVSAEFFGNLGGGVGGIELEAVDGSDEWETLKDDSGSVVAISASGQGVSFLTQAANWRPVLTGATGADAKVLFGIVS